MQHSTCVKNSVENQNQIRSENATFHMCEKLC